MKHFTMEQAQTIMEASAKISNKAIKTIASRGNPYALEFMTNPNHAIHEDLQQAVNLALCENADFITFKADYVTDTPNAENLIKNDFLFLGFTFTDYKEIDVVRRDKDENGETIKNSTYTIKKTVSESKQAAYKTIQKTLDALRHEYTKRDFIPMIDENGIESAVMVTKALQAELNSIGNAFILELIEELQAELTPREKSVFSLIMEGFTEREIAERLKMGKGTVSMNTKSIKKKMRELNSIMND